MSRHLYKQYLRLIAKWPKDQFKTPERDLSMFLSKQVETVFKSPPTEAGLCERRYHALEKLYNNEVITLYPHKYTSGVFGLKLHQLQEASSEANRKHFGLAKKENIIRKAWNLVAPAKESSHKSQ